MHSTCKLWCKPLEVGAPRQAHALSCVHHLTFDATTLPCSSVLLFRRWMIQMRGASGTLYADELFTLQVDFPENYPMEAPQVLWHFHPPQVTHWYTPSRETEQALLGCAPFPLRRLPVCNSGFCETRKGGRLLR